MRLSLFLLSLWGLLAPSALALWPQPAKMAVGSKFLRVSSELSFGFSSEVDQSRVPQDLAAQIGDTLRAIQRQPMLPLEVDRGASWESRVSKAPKLTNVELTIVQLLKQHPNKCEAGTPKRFQKAFPGVGAESPCSIHYWTTQPFNTSALTGKKLVVTDKPIPDHLSPRDAEAYELDIPADGGTAKIRAYTALGALRGLKTFQQLVYSLNRGDNPNGYIRYIQNAPVSIEDRPAFPYRGLLLDTSRNFFPLSSIKRLIDGMALVKLNQFHWHVTDAQSWPLALERRADDGLDLSELAATGAYGPDKVYTERDVRSLIAYAGERGVNVNLEIDMPAHLSAGVGSLGDKKLVACADEENWLNVAAEPPSGQLNLRPDNTSTGVAPEIEKFVRAVLSRVATLTPSPYLSSGGDEPNLKCWRAENEAAIDEGIMKPFMGIVTDTLTKAGKKGWVWEEMAIKFTKTGASLAKGSIVEAWTTADNVGAILAANPGTFLIHAPSTHFYLDCGHGGWLGGRPDDSSWCNFVSWKKTYSFDPYNGTKTEADRARVLGGESALWTEQIDQYNLEVRTWPRAASAAEVFWTGASYSTAAFDSHDKEGGAVEHKRNVEEALDRFLDVRERLVAAGIGAEPLQPLWCVLRRGRCNWPTP
ncbi:Glucosamine-6-phosphate isomerase (Glucosamine-6-phosphate deaminase) (GNPDA) (GlcN6P deaminase) [Thecaphora frezii]|nr:putative chitinase 4 [Thecaphora frezii]